MSVQKFRKKPVEIEAMRWDGTADSAAAICWWANEPQETGDPIDEPWVDYTTVGEAVREMMCHTLEGALNVSVGDWIIRGVQGEFYPCKPDIFAATYEAVS
jgi:hypothetical protein